MTTRAAIATAIALLALGAPAIGQPVLQPDDRGGPGYTTGTTMGREGVPSSAPSSAGSPSSAAHRRTTTRRPGTIARRPTSHAATAGTPVMYGRGTETDEGGAGTTGGPGSGAAKLGH